MGEVVAQIRCAQGRPSIEDWIYQNKIVSTSDIAARFCMPVDEALTALKRMEREGRVERVKPEIGYARNVAWWTAEGGPVTDPTEGDADA